MVSTSVAVTTRQSGLKGLRLYQYEPLPTQPVHIRLVRISPSRYRHDKELRCELRTVILESSLDFCAISYEWGPIDDGHEIHICTRDGIHSIKVRRNLRNFLRRVRDDQDFLGRWLWIDQICIDQQSNDEKSHQVLHMRSIYRTASRTIVWIHSAPLMMDLGLGMFGCFFKRPALPIKHDRVHAILESSYWRRVWIIQEVVLSRSMRFMTPTYTTDLASLESYKCFDKFYRSYLRFEGFAASSRIISLRHSFRLRDSGLKEIESWSGALSSSNRSVASIPADRVYALLGLMQPKLRINPDYTASHLNILIRVMMVEIMYAKPDPEFKYYHVWCELEGALNITGYVDASIVPSCTVFGFWLRELGPSNQKALKEATLDSFIRICGEVARAFSKNASRHWTDFVKEREEEIQQSWYPFQWLCQDPGITLDDSMLMRLRSFKELGTRVDDSWFEANKIAGSPLRDMMEALAFQTEGLASAVSRLREEQDLQSSSAESGAPTKYIAGSETTAG